MWWNGTRRFQRTLLVCTTCRGTGSVPAPERGHAEFIRAEIELTKCRPDCGIGKVCRGVTWPGVVTCAGVRDRRRELLALHGAAWRAGPVCERCMGVYTGGLGYDNYATKCTRCDGTGDAGGLLREWSIEERHDAGLLRGTDRLRHRITRDRGFIFRVEVPRQADLLYSVGGGSANPNWQPTPLLRQLLAPTPYRAITEIVPLDREPEEHAPGSGQSEWCWYDASTGGGAEGYWVPSPLLALMRDESTDEYLLGSRLSFPSRAAAVSALGRAVVAFASTCLGFSP